MRNKIIYSVFAVTVLVSLLHPLVSEGQEEYVFLRSWPEEEAFFKWPLGLAVADSGAIYVSDLHNHRIVKLTPDGSVLLTWGMKGFHDGQFDGPHGIAVDSAEFVYVADAWNARIQKFTPDGKFVTKWGTWGYSDGEFANPQGIAVDRFGFVYVADTENCRIQKFTSDGKFVTEWGMEGDGPGEFSEPHGIVVTDSGFVYVADTWNHRIQEFTVDGDFLGVYPLFEEMFWLPTDIAVDDFGNLFVSDSYYQTVQVISSNGVFLGEWGTYGTADGDFRNPRAIAIDGQGYVYVADTDNHRIQKFMPNGDLLTKWGTEGIDDGLFYRPFNVALDGFGRVYVADTYNHRIQKFSPDGIFLTKWGDRGDSDEEFTEPYGIAADNAGNVYVSDSSGVIRKFTSEGRFLIRWGRWGSGDREFDWPADIAVDGSGNVYVADGNNNRIQKFTSNGVFLIKWGTYGDAPGEFDVPTGIAVDSRDNVYVVDSGNRRVQKFTAEGRFLIKWGTEGDEPGQLNEPIGIAVDSAGNVYVVDSSNHRIQKFTSNGQFLTQWGEWGFEGGQFDWPTGIAVDDKGNVYVVDNGNHRIQKFASRSADQPPEFDFSEGLVGAWKFDDGTARDFSGMSNHGFILGDPEVVVGRLGEALDFDGNDDGIVIPDDPSLQLPDALTVSAWIYPRAVNDHAGIVWKGSMIGWTDDASERSYNWCIAMVEPSGLTWGTSAANGQEGWFTTAEVLPELNRWYHVVLVEDGAKATAYVDGRAMAFADIDERGIDVSASYAVSEDQPVRIGWSRGVGGDIDNRVHFDGIIDEVVIYNRALNEEELVLLMNKGLPQDALNPTGGEILPPTADFSAEPTSGTAPLTVKFTDLSQNGPMMRYLWRFGDGEISDLRNPTHTYIEPGDYTVSLVVANPAGSDGKLEEKYIHVRAEQVLPSDAVIGRDGAPMVMIPAGEFQMGSNDGKDNERPVHTVYLDAFYMDVYEVTNAQYRRFVQATGHREPEGTTRVNGALQAGFKPWSDRNFSGDDQPVVCVSWEDAKAYAEWVGKRLPTEAEWEKAARGGLAGKKYTWGDTWPPPRDAGNFADEAAGDALPSIASWGFIEGYYDGYIYPAPVGSFDPNGYSLYDMAGNVWEWCADGYDSGYYARSPRSNPTGPDSGRDRVQRGGSWHYGALWSVSVACRGYSPPQDAVSDHGFRCVEPGPSLSLSPASLDFEETDTADSFTITNTGGGTLTWQIASQQPGWMILSSTSGSVESGGYSKIVVTVNRANMDPGAHEHTISITSNGGDGSISLAMTVPEPEPSLSLSPASLDFGTTDTDDSFTMTNAGGGLLTWQIASQQPGWVTLSSTSGSIESGDQSEVDVTVNRSSLGAGSHDHTISLTSNGGDGSVLITVTVPEPEPSLSLSPESLDFGETVEKNSFIVNNSGAGTLTWQIDSQQPGWITLSHTSGSIQSGDETRVDVTVNRSNLGAGSYNHAVSLTSNGGNGSVSVKMTVPKPVMQPPVGLTAQEAEGTVELSWGVSSDSSVIGYNVYRGVKGDKTGSKVNPVLVTAVTYIDETPEADKTYWYSVTAVNAQGEESEKSEQIEIGIKGAVLQSPTGLTAQVKTGTVELSWAISSDSSVIGYNVYRGEIKGETGAKINAVLVAAVIYTDTPPETDKTYWYSVTSVNAHGEESGKSEAAEIFVPGPDFEIKSDQSTQSAQAGKTATFVISLEKKYGFDSTVDLSVKGLPDGVTASFTPVQLSSTQKTSNLTLDTSLSVSQGKHEFEVLGISGDKVRRTGLALEVTSPPAKIGSAITVDVQDEVQWNSTLTVSGEIFDPQDTSVKFGSAQVSLTFTSPASQDTEKTAITDSSGNYSFVFSDISSESMGEWKVKAEWSGNDTHFAAKKENEFEVIKVVPEIAWDAGNATELEIVDEESISISGRINPSPGAVEVVLSITDPDGGSDSEKKETSNLGTFTFVRSIDKEGQWTFVVSWDGDSEYDKTSSDDYDLKVESAIGKVIIMQGGGDKNNNNDWNLFDSLASYVYDAFKRRKFTDDDIYYLSPERENDVDTVTSMENLEYAITTWAPDKLNSKLSLYIYLISHNGSKGLLVDKTDGVEKYLTGKELDGWLDQLENKCKDITLVIEACYSGGLIADLSAEDRIIITSAQASTEATIWPNYSFTSFFFDDLVENRNIKESFESASKYVTADELFGDQIPQLEANGDGTSNDIDDKVAAEIKYIDGNYDSLTKLANPPEITEASKDQKLAEEANKATVWVQVSAMGAGERVWGTIVPPDHREAGVEYALPDIDFPAVDFKSIGGSKYEGTYENLDEEGTYKILIYAQDADGTSQPRVTKVIVPEKKKAVEPKDKQTVSWGNVKTCAIPREPALRQNYPNPFNPETWIPYQLAKDADVVIRIYTAAGQLIRTLNPGRKQAGFYINKEKAAHWDGNNGIGERAASGTYFYSIEAGDFTAICKMVVVE